MTTEETLEEILESMSNYSCIMLYKSTEEFWNGINNTVRAIWIAEVEDGDIIDEHGEGRTPSEALVELREKLQR